VCGIKLSRSGSAQRRNTIKEERREKPKDEEIKTVNKGRGEVKAEDNEQDIKRLKGQNISVWMCLDPGSDVAMIMCAQIVKATLMKTLLLLVLHSGALN
jgi:hypothetical protein